MSGSATTLLEVTDQIQKFWSPMFMAELRAAHLLGALVNKDYSGEIKAEGDTVKVSQISAAKGQLKTVGVDSDSFQAEKLVTTQVPVTANKRAIASFKFNDLVDIQSQIGSQQSAIREALLYGVMDQMNNYLYSKVAPSASNPAHVLTGVSTFAASNLSAVRTLAAKAKWLKSKPWYGLLNPDYYGNLLDAQTMTSRDYVEGEQPVIGGQIVNQRYGFSLLEDNSRTAKTGLFFHPDFLMLVMQTQPTFKISDLHSQEKLGYLVSVDLIFGAELGIDGAKKHITVGP